MSVEAMMGYRWITLTGPKRPDLGPQSYESIQITLADHEGRPAWVSRRLLHELGRLGYTGMEQIPPGQILEDMDEPADVEASRPQDPQATGT